MDQKIPDRELQYEQIPTDDVKKPSRWTRRITRKQIQRLKRSIEAKGFLDPILIDEENALIAGLARVLVAEELGMPTIPIIRAHGLTKEQKRDYAIAQNRLCELGEWDRAIVIEDLVALTNIGYDATLTGFDTADIDKLLGLVVACDTVGEVGFPASRAPVISRPGDSWMIGDHFIYCGDARDPVSYQRLLRGGSAQMVFTDPPYNVPIAGHVSGLGKTVHREFAMASGEMNPSDFTKFLNQIMVCMATVSQLGAIHYVCMDWRHIGELLEAARNVYSEFKNLCVWAKTNAGMGAFYRSQHELVFVLKVGTAPHINNFGLGAKGRYRTNVWSYEGVNTFRLGRNDDLAAHPTVKPIPMVIDAILDCSDRNGIILDPFAGSGTTLLAAARTGRFGYGIEIDPAYVDLCVRRMEEELGVEAIHENEASFSEVAALRLGQQEAA